MTSITLTSDQITWYESLKPLVDQFGIGAYLDTPQERNLFRKIAAQFAPAPAPVAQRTTVRRFSGQVRWSTAELELITDLYLQHVRPDQEHDARATILREFRRQFSTHSDDAVELTVRRIIRLDTHYPSDGMLGAAYQYFQILDRKCPDRFLPPGDL